jgi:hypothetical protein
MRVLTIVCCLCVLTAAAAADLYAASFTGPVLLQLPGCGQVQSRVFVRAGAGKWQPAQFEETEGRLLFRLDPAKLGSGDIMLVVNPPASLMLDDTAGPRVTGLKVDGKACKLAPTVDLGPLGTPPHEVVAAFADVENAVAPGSPRASLDGAPATLAGPACDQPQKQVRLVLPLPDLEYGAHEVVLSAADNSPQRNVGSCVVRFNYLESGNVALAALGATVQVDSSFAGYESLVCLNDGVTALSGTSCGNDVTWASTETPIDHWAEVTLPKPTAIKEVTVYWAAYTDVAHTATQFQIQVPDGAGWKAVYSSPAEGEKSGRVTTARFDPLTTTKFRIFMPAGKGSTTRPNLLWITEIKAR